VSLRKVFIVVLAAVVVAAGATACEPRETRRDRPVLFIHGWSGFGNGNDCNANFGTMKTALRADGFTGPLVTVGYYDTNRNCDIDLQEWGPITNGSVWKDISKAFARYVYENYTKRGIAVDVVGHSMGGLVVRGAVQGTQAKEAGFGPAIKVEDVVTFGAPFAGAAWYSTFCLWGQCSQLKPGASDLKWLATNGNPQGAEGTEWTAFASNSDDVVPADSALSISVPAERKVRYSSLAHGDFMHNATSQARAAKALAEVGS
jgi:pimeloyl-ACP methyl ester carboxylesterase